MREFDEVYRLRAEVRDLADEISRWTPWRDASAGASGIGQVAKVGSEGLSAATSILAPGGGEVIIHDYDVDPPAPGDTVAVANPFKIAIDADTTVVIVLCGVRWVVVAMECGA